MVYRVWYGSAILEDSSTTYAPRTVRMPAASDGGRSKQGHSCDGRRGRVMPRHEVLLGDKLFSWSRRTTYLRWLSSAEVIRDLGGRRKAWRPPPASTVVDAAVHLSVRRQQPNFVTQALGSRCLPARSRSPPDAITLKRTAASRDAAAEVCTGTVQARQHINISHTRRVPGS